MDEALATLQQRLTYPSIDELQNVGMCRICWTDYEGADCPIKLPCGHVFRKECILVWAQGTTPSGHPNGCPFCRTELLPPSFSSRLRGLIYDGVTIWLLFLYSAGGYVGFGFYLALRTSNTLLKMLPESQNGVYIQWVIGLLLSIYWAHRAFSLFGWGWMLCMLLVREVLIEQEYLMG